MITIRLQYNAQLEKPNSSAMWEKVIPRNRNDWRTKRGESSVEGVSLSSDAPNELPSDVATVVAAKQ